MLLFQIGSWFHFRTVQKICNMKWNHESKNVHGEKWGRKNTHTHWIYSRRFLLCDTILYLCAVRMKIPKQSKAKQKQFGTAHIVFTLDRYYSRYTDAVLAYLPYVWLILLTWHWFHANSMIYFVQHEWNKSHTPFCTTQQYYCCSCMWFVVYLKKKHRFPTMILRAKLKFKLAYQRKKTRKKQQQQRRTQCDTN